MRVNLCPSVLNDFSLDRTLRSISGLTISCTFATLEDKVHFANEVRLCNVVQKRNTTCLMHFLSSNNVSDSACQILTLFVVPCCTFVCGSRVHATQWPRALWFRSLRPAKCNSCTKRHFLPSSNCTYSADFYCVFVFILR